MKVNHLYVHVPFCTRICYFCDFFKVQKSKDEMIDEYLFSLSEEVNNIKLELELKTIYIGGGTPNCLDIARLERLLEIISKLNTNNLVEYTIELNPEHVTIKQLLLLKKYNVNRLSFGVQTFNDVLLKKLNREHNSKQAIDAYKLARDLGFDNISFDLMYNLFDQTLDDIKADIEHIKTLKPDHISWYSLILKEDSFWGKVKDSLPENDIDFDIYINQELKNMNYHRYEISNYCLDKNKVSYHNLAYWTNKSYYPLGPAACGFITDYDKNYYLINNSRKYKNWVSTTEQLSQRDYYFQILMMGLRLVEGIQISEIKNSDLAIKAYENKISQEIRKGNLEYKENHYLKCSPKGYDILNDILVNIMD